MNGLKEERVSGEITVHENMLSIQVGNLAHDIS